MAKSLIIHWHEITRFSLLIQEMRKLLFLATFRVGLHNGSEFSLSYAQIALLMDVYNDIQDSS